MSNFGSYDPNRKPAGANKHSKRFYLSDGSNLFRVLPPVKSLRDSNKIANYKAVIWLTDSNNKKRVVNSILRKQNKQVVQNDPLVDKADQMQAELTQAIARGENPAVINMMRENMKRVRIDKGYDLNVISASGEYGVLSIPYTSYVNLDKRLAELQTQGIDAIGVGPDKGVFLDFKRLRDERGKNIYPVDPATKTSKDANGNFTMTYIRAPLTEDEANRLAEQAEDLTKLYRTLSYEEMEALATLDQRVFDVIFARPQAIVEETDSAVDNETQEELNGYQTTQSATGTTGHIPTHTSGYIDTTQMTPPSYTQTAHSTQMYTVNPPNNTVNAQTTAASGGFGQTRPTGTGFTNGSAVDNKKVQNFLFPDKKG